MARTYDVVILGLGAMGSSAASHLAARGHRVLAVEQYTPAHSRGSSHGKTRIIRQAYFENPAYVPLLQRAYELWRDLEQHSGERLLFETGGLMIGRPDSSVVAGSQASARHHDLPHEILDAREVRRRFAALRPPADQVALLERRAGYLLSDRCVLAQLDRASRFGAELRFEEEVLSWEPSQGGVRVVTSRGTYEAGHLIITPGPWAPSVMRELGLPLVVERQVLYWFMTAPEASALDAVPIYIWEKGDGTIPYGFPAIDGATGGAKVAFHAAPVRTLCTADDVDRLVRADEIADMQRAISPLIPSLSGPCVQTATCLYTNTPDGHFILTAHPHCPQVQIACGFSGHGFKFASVIGEILADLTTSGATSLDIAFLGTARFASARADAQA